MIDNGGAEASAIAAIAVAHSMQDASRRHAGRSRLSTQSRKAALHTGGRASEFVGFSDRWQSPNVGLGRRR